MRYPHGWNMGGVVPGTPCPAITTSNWQDNNFLLTINDMEEYSEIELRPDSQVKPLGNCRFDIDGRQIEFRIRKLTPTECLKLMDVPQWAIERMTATGDDGKQIISNSQLYKLAGNSIVTSCLYHLYEQIWFPKQPTSLTPKQLTLF